MTVKIEILNLLKHTPALDSIYTASSVVNCFGKTAELTDISLSLWSSYDLIHAIYVANDLYLKEKECDILIGNKLINDRRKYHVIVSGINDKNDAEKLKIKFELKGFMKVLTYLP